MKRVVRLVQTYLSVKNIELEIRPFTDEDETLDTRGQPITSSAAVTSSLAEPVTSLKKTRKKRRSKRASQEVEESVTAEQGGQGSLTVLKNKRTI